MENDYRFKEGEFPDINHEKNVLTVSFVGWDLSNTFPYEKMILDIDKKTYFSVFKLDICFNPHMVENLILNKKFYEHEFNSFKRGAMNCSTNNKWGNYFNIRFDPQEINKSSSQIEIMMPTILEEHERKKYSGKGKPRINNFVHTFYAKMIDDCVLIKYYSGLDMNKTDLEIIKNKNKEKLDLIKSTNKKLVDLTLKFIQKEWNEFYQNLERLK